MKIFGVGKDGGKESTVTGYWLCEFKRLVSIVLLKFEGKSREAYHTHAFSCISWLLKGELRETMIDGRVFVHRPSLIPIVTRRKTFHKVDSDGTSWVFSIRGPWKSEWSEYIPGQDKHHVLTHGRVVVEEK